MNSTLIHAGALGCALLATTCLNSRARADIVPPKTYVTTPGGINIADGSLVHSVTDLSIGALTLDRFHRSGSNQPNDAFFGKNFTHNFDIYVSVNPQVYGTTNRPVVHIGGTASGVYWQTKGNLPSIGPNNQDAERGVLEWSGANSFTGGNYVYTDSSGTVYTFSRTVSAVGVPFTSRRVAQIAFPDGRVQTFTYNGGGQLRLVEDSSGYAILFDYNGAGDVSAACGFNRSQTYVSSSSSCAGTALRTTYGYDGSGYLTSVVDVMNGTTTYGNYLRGITCIIPPGQSACQMSTTYSGNRVGAQTLADGGTWTVTGDDPLSVNDPDKPAPYDGHNSVTVTDPAGVTTNHSFTLSSPYTLTDAAGHTTRYHFTGARQFDDTGPAYDHGTMLAEAELPEGNRYLAEYNGPFRSVTRETMVPRPGSNLPNEVRERGYNLCVAPATRQNCAQPIWVRDASNNQTDFTYAPHGGLLTEMQPAPTAGAARPLKVRTYVQRYAYVRDSGGSLVPAAAPVWLPAAETLCQTAAGSNTAVCDPNAPQTVTSFEYGAAGSESSIRLLGTVVTAGGVSRRSCVSYDAQGNRLSETQPMAGLASCP